MTSIRVADVTQLPPGKGRVLSLADRVVRVYNVDGRFFATATREARMAHGPMDTTHLHGATFDVYTEDSPASVQADQEQLAVRVDDDVVWLDLPEG